MTLILEDSEHLSGTKAASDEVSVKATETHVRVGDCYLTMEDFCYLVVYALTNSDLQRDDCRLHLIDTIKKLQPVEGWNEGKKKLWFDGVDALVSQKFA